MRTKFLLTTAAAAAGLTAASSVAPAQDATLPTVTTVWSAGQFGTYAPGRVASTYDPALVPTTAHAEVFQASVSGGLTVTTLQVSGLLPNRRYGSHAHVNACGATGAAAGPHYQNEADPVQPSVDPAYANPYNEIWLDFITDKYGRATSVSTEHWGFSDRRPMSVVIHAMGTMTDPGTAGTAGARLACINLNKI